MKKKIKKLLKILEKEKKKNKKLKNKLLNQKQKGQSSPPLSIKSVNIFPEPDFPFSKKNNNSVQENSLSDNPLLSETTSNNTISETPNLSNSVSKELNNPKTTSEFPIIGTNTNSTKPIQEKTKPKKINKQLCFLNNDNKRTFSEETPSSLFIPEKENIIEEKPLMIIPPSKVQNSTTIEIPNNEAVAYTDGSHNQYNNKIAYGLVFFCKGKKQTENGKVPLLENEKPSSQAAETYAVIHAIDKAIQEGCKKISIYYDCLAISQWVSCPGKKNKRAQWYSQKIIQRMQKIKITLNKVKAHSGDICNNEADYLAKCATRN